ncbi:MAG: TrmH family RNA methyltransferase, partial [Fidelibacterota bacterium]
MNAERNPIYVIADNIRSLYNIGSIFRSCEAAGIKK